jgi:murein DD-endopeptidase MepM/ murein hydrolase activator NlpD
MFKRKRFGVLASILLLTMLAQLGTVLAGEQSPQQLREQMDQQKAAETKAQKQVDVVSAQMHQIQQELDAAQSEYAGIQSKLTVTEQQIQANKEVLAKTQSDLAKRSQVLDQRVRDIYQNGQISYLDVLLGATNFNDFVTRMDLVRRIIHSDVALVMQVKAERTLVQEKSNQLAQDKAAMVELEKAAAQKKTVLEARKKDRQAALNLVTHNRDMAQAAYEQMQNAYQQVMDRLRSSGQDYSPGQAAGAGGMIWPVRGVITSPFGWRWHPILGGYRFHTGIDIAADIGEPVHAAASGVVAYAGWISGYGYAVIINHGGGISTLYAHNSQLLVSAGQAVQQGQVISKAGMTGYATGPHVHFEVRVNDHPVNPLGYLPGG